MQGTRQSIEKVERFQFRTAKEGNKKVTIRSLGNAKKERRCSNCGK